MFPRKSLRPSLDDSGYVIEQFLAVGPPFEAVMPGKLGKFLGFVGDCLARVWPSLFAFQFVLVAKPYPGVRQLLRAGELHCGVVHHDAPALTNLASPTAAASFTTI